MTAAEIDTTASGSAGKKRPRKRSRKSKSTGDGAGAAAEVASPSEGATSTKVEASGSRQPQASASASASQRDRTSGEPPAKSPRVTSQPPSTTPAPAILTSNPHKPSVLPRPSVFGPRQYTLSIALPSSIVLNAQTMELKTRLVGSIARICAVFNVDEVVVFNDGHAQDEQPQGQGSQYQHGFRGGKRPWEGDEERHSQAQGFRGGDRDREREREPFDADSFTSMIFQYLETPQYMRKALFPMHPNLRLAGLLPPLDLPHHLRLDEESPFREGLVVDGGAGGRTQTVWVNVGFREPIECTVPAKSKEQVPQAGTRVTVEMPQGGHYGKGRLVSPRAPVQSQGLYWGYSVRLVPSLSQVFTGCPFSEGEGTGAEYDLVIGTAERGDALTDVLHATDLRSPVSSSKAAAGAGSYRSDADAEKATATVNPLPENFAHALILFGGLSGLEVAIERDEGIPLGREDAHELCDFWVDVCEGQGSRTVRTEEAITITLARLKTALEQLGRR